MIKLMRPLFVSKQPFSELVLFQNQAFSLTQPFLARSDLIITKVRSMNHFRQTLLNDFISNYSPLTCKVGDVYFKTSSKFYKEFLN